MKPLFDIEYITFNFANIENIRHYFGLIQSASDAELVSFRRQVIKHKDNIIKSSSFYGRPVLLEHGYIISAINHELLKRSWCYKSYKCIFPFRQWLVKIFSNIDLIEDDLRGSIYISCKNNRNIWHLNHKEITKNIAFFIKHHSYKTLMVIGTFGMFILLLIKQLN